MENYHSSNTQNIFSHPKPRLIIGSLVLLLSLIFVNFGIKVFFLFAIEVPLNGIGMSNICSWQYSLSDDLIYSGRENIPFLTLLHVMTFLFIVRLWREKQYSSLPLEFGILNILFAVVGMGVFVFTALIEIMASIIPGSVNWANTLIGCEPTSLALPGIITTVLMTMGLIYSQTTGWLAQKIAPLATAIELNDRAATGKDVAYRKFIINGGILLLILTLAILLSWLVLFLTYAVQLPEGGWACWGAGCERAVWQPALSRYFAFSPSARLQPFLLVLHIALIVFFFRYRHKDDRIFLPFEIGGLGILFMLLGTFVFAGTITVYKMTNPPNQAVAPMVEQDGTIVFIPALPQIESVAKDDTGFITMDSKDDLYYIYSQIPWEVNPRLRATAGVIASTILVLGLFFSMVSGWLNRLIRRLSPKSQRNLLLLMLLTSTIIFFIELHIFGFYLFW